MTTGHTRQDRKRLWDEGPEAHELDAMDRVVAWIFVIAVGMLVFGGLRYLVLRW